MPSSTFHATQRAVRELTGAYAIAVVSKREPGRFIAARMGCPLLVGPSRKSFIGKVDGSAADERIGGTIASSVLAAAEGADVLRVHDVAEVAQATLAG